MENPQWFRWVLVVAAFMNVLGALTFMPPFPALRALAQLPSPEPPLYAWLLALWILFFGLAYLRLAYVKTQERLFLQIATAGKLSFVVLLFAFWLQGDLPTQALQAGVNDLIFACIFAFQLYQSRDT